MYVYYSRLKKIKDNIYWDFFTQKRVEIIERDNYDLLSNLYHEKILNILFYGEKSNGSKFYAFEYFEPDTPKKKRFEGIKNEILDFFKCIGKKVSLSKDSYSGKYKVLKIEEDLEIKSPMGIGKSQGYKKIIRKETSSFLSLLEDKRRVNLFGERRTGKTTFVEDIINILQLSGKIVFFFNSLESFYKEIESFLFLGEEEKGFVINSEVFHLLDNDATFIFFDSYSEDLNNGDLKLLINSFKKANIVVISNHSVKEDDFVKFEFPNFTPKEIEEIFFWSHRSGKLFEQSGRDIGKLKKALFSNSSVEFDFRERFALIYHFLYERYPSTFSKVHIEKLEKKRTEFGVGFNDFFDEAIFERILKENSDKKLSLNDSKIRIIYEKIKNRKVLKLFFLKISPELRESNFFIFGGCYFSDKELRVLYQSLDKFPYHKMEILKKVKVKTDEEKKELLTLLFKNSEYKEALNLIESNGAFFSDEESSFLRIRLYRILGFEDDFLKWIKVLKNKKYSQKIISRLLLEEGIFYYGRGELKKAEKIFNKIISSTNDSDVDEEVRRYLYYIDRRKGKGKLSDLLEIYKEKLNKVDYFALGELSSDIGQYYFKKKTLFKALSWFELSEYYFKKIENKKAFTLSLFNQGEVLKEMGALERSEGLIKKALLHDNSSGNLLSKIIDLFSLGEIEFLKGNFRVAKKYLDEALNELPMNRIEKRIPLFPVFYDFVSTVEGKKKKSPTLFLKWNDFEKIIKKFAANYYDELKILLMFLILSIKDNDGFDERIIQQYKKGIKKFNLEFYEKLLDSVLRGKIFHLDNYHEKLSCSEIIGFETGLSKVKEMADRIKNLPFSVLITGESGTGKELMAKYLHYTGERRDAPFITVNCAAIPKELLEAMFFGYKKGAFTGADQDKKGFIESAHKGTLFLDEIGELPLEMQSKLLRVIQEKEITEIGSTFPKKVDVRFIFATNRDLKKEVEKENFRKDLFFRINEFTLELPPLRERREDIPLLVNYFIKKYESFVGKRNIGITQDALRALLAYSWPGNIRELEAKVKKSIVLLGENELILDSKHFDINFVEKALLKIESLKKVKEEAEKKYLLKLLPFLREKSKSEIADMLGISRMQFYNLLKKYNIEG